MNKESEEIIFAFIQSVNSELDSLQLILQEIKHRVDVLWLMKGPTIL